MVGLVLEAEQATEARSLLGPLPQPGVLLAKPGDLTGEPRVLRPEPPNLSDEVPGVIDRVADSREAGDERSDRRFDGDAEPTNAAASRHPHLVGQHAEGKQAQ